MEVESKWSSPPLSPTGQDTEFTEKIRISGRFDSDNYQPSNTSETISHAV